jgi:hypothetical protein
MPEWAVGILGVIMGVAATSLWQWLDRRERYRVMTFEKRLEAHQHAHYLCTQAWLLLIDLKRAEQNTIKIFETDKESEELVARKLESVKKLEEATGKLQKFYQESVEWLTQNCLYLDHRSQILFPEAIIAIANEATTSLVKQIVQIEEKTLKKTSDVIIPKLDLAVFGRDTVEKLNEALEAIAKGVGGKYLPQMHEEIERQRELIQSQIKSHDSL